MMFTGVALLIRSKMEDDMLKEELEGYNDYTRRVRYRLVAGVW
ncbi:MAG: hypothetical protein ACLFV5_04860 [Anaerolineales bacterium]